MPFYSIEFDWMHCGIWNNVQVCFMMQCLSLTLSNGWCQGRRGEEMTWNTHFEPNKPFVWNWVLIKVMSPWQMVYFMFTVSLSTYLSVIGVSMFSDCCTLWSNFFPLWWEKWSCNVCTEDLIWSFWSFLVASFMVQFAGFHIWSDESITLIIITQGLQTSRRFFSIASLEC